jgi:type I restriction enzyme S subunit
VICSSSDPILIWDGSNAGDVFMGCTGVLASTMVQLVPNPDRLTPDFLFYFLKTQFTVLNGRTTGSTIPHVNKTVFETLAVPLPPLPEQRAIAGVLRTVQRAREACERLLAATRQLKHSLLHHLFTYGPVPIHQADQVPLKQTEIGPMPEHWTTQRVGDLGEVVTGTTPSTKHPEYYGGTHMFITPGDLGEAKYISRTEKWLSDVGIRQCRPVPKGAVVVVCIGATIGKTGLTTTDGCATNQQCNTVIVNRGADPEFLFYALSLRAAQLPLLAGRAAVPIVNKSNFCSFKVPVPPLSEQREIAAMLGAVDAQIAALEARRTALAALFTSLLEHLMTGRLRLPEFRNAGAPAQQDAERA